MSLTRRGGIAVGAAKERISPLGIRYELTRKRVKNINFRVRTDGTLAVSASARVPLKQIDALVDERREWVEKARNHAAEQAALHTAPCPVSAAEALALFTALEEPVYRQFCTAVPQRPTLCVRDMKTRWGVCCPARRRITLNLRLACIRPRSLPMSSCMNIHILFIAITAKPFGKWYKPICRIGASCARNCVKTLSTKKRAAYLHFL